MIVSKKTPQLGLLLGHLVRPTGETVAAQRVVRGARRDRIGLPTGRLDRRQRVLPARSDADVEARVREPDVSAHDPREEDVPDALVAGVVPVDPVLLDEHAPETEPRRDGGHLPRVVRLNTADRDERVATLRQRVGR
jgi:hypothetical protein